MIEDIKKVLGNKEDFWLNASVLLYVALLPFNAFSFHVFPGPYFRLNLTKGALLLVIVLGLRAYFKGRIKIKKAYLLYLFLTIQVLANLLSVVNSPNPTESFMLTVTISQYCVLVFVLIHVVRSEVLLRVILRVMAIFVLVVIAHSIGIFLWRGGVFFTRTQPSMLGNGIGHYLSYFLIMFGTGLVYSLFVEKSKVINCLLWLSTGLWAFVIHINAMKAGSITIVVFALLLLSTAYKEWRKAIPLVGVVVAVFFLVLQLVPIVNSFLPPLESEPVVLTPGGGAPSEPQVLTPGGGAPSEPQVLTPGGVHLQKN